MLGRATCTAGGKARCLRVGEAERLLAFRTDVVVDLTACRHLLDEGVGVPRDTLNAVLRRAVERALEGRWLRGAVHKRRHTVDAFLAANVLVSTRGALDGVPFDTLAVSNNVAIPASNAEGVVAALETVGVFADCV